MIKSIVLAIAGFFLIVFALIPGFLGPDDLAGCGAEPSDSGKCATADVIVAVSGGDTDSRAAEAINLYKNGWAPKVIFSGAAEDKSGPSNATIMARQAMSAGVPAVDISTDNDSNNTEQNANNTETIIANLHAKRMILVTSAYHQRRAYMEFHQKLGDGVTVVNHPAPLDNGWSKFWWLTPNGWFLALGELARIIFLMFQGVQV